MIYEGLSNILLNWLSGFKFKHLLNYFVFTRHVI